MPYGANGIWSPGLNQAQGGKTVPSELYDALSVDSGIPNPQYLVGHTQFESFVSTQTLIESFAQYPTVYADDIYTGDLPWSQLQVPYKPLPFE